MSIAELFLFSLMMMVDCTNGVSQTSYPIGNIDQQFERLERLLLEKDHRIDQLEAKLTQHVTAFTNYVVKRDAEMTSVNSELVKLELKVKQKEYVIQELRQVVEDLETKVSNRDFTKERKIYPNGDDISTSHVSDHNSERITENNEIGRNGTILNVRDDIEKSLPSNDIPSVDENGRDLIRVAPNIDTNIAFHAVMTVFTGPMIKGSALVYNQEILDHGNGYSETDGLYLVPESGTYVITWTTVTYHDYVQTLLVVNGVTRGSSVTDAGEVTDIHQTTMIVVLVLNQGDHVSIRVGNVGRGTLHTSDAYNYPAFSGWKLAGM
ncbi:uncharacterized protein [Argopecten irradians]|uniref:uncharacterized protein n=1 Tax=Argopecten irradians TaxID=31199 RepID=UPI003710EE4C